MALPVALRCMISNLWFGRTKKMTQKERSSNSPRSDCNDDGINIKPKLKQE
jgi:hypothetical protein